MSMITLFNGSYSNAREIIQQLIEHTGYRLIRDEDVVSAAGAMSELGPSKIGKAVYSGLRAARSLANWLDLKAQDRLDAYDYNDLVANEAGFGRQA